MFCLCSPDEELIDKAITESPACAKVAELNELIDLATLDMTLNIIISMSFHHHEGKVGIIASGGVEAVFKVMKTFPECRLLQERACGALRNLTNDKATGRNNAIESGGIEILLAAVNNHLSSSDICKHACRALYSIVSGSKENTQLLINLGGATAVAKAREMWRNKKTGSLDCNGHEGLG
jgi:hypothetical protein